MDKYIKPVIFPSKIIGPNPKGLESYGSFCNRFVFCPRDYQAIKCGSIEEPLCRPMTEKEKQMQIPLKYLQNILTNQ